MGWFSNYRKTRYYSWNWSGLKQSHRDATDWFLKNGGPAKGLHPRNLKKTGKDMKFLRDNPGLWR